MLSEKVRGILYPAPRELSRTPSDYGCKYRDVSFRSQDGCGLHGWWLPHRRASATVIFCHGNGENVGDWADIGDDLDFLNANVFVFDYRGYGSSHGSPSETGLCWDVRAAFDCVRRDCSTLPVVAMGRSLGGAVAIELARSRPVAGLVVESSFTCTADVAKTIPGLNLLPKSVVAFLVKNDPWDSVARLADLRMPKLFAHSRTDEVIGFDIGTRLFEAATDPKEFCLLSGGHNHVKFQQKRYRHALLGLVGAAGRCP